MYCVILYKVVGVENKIRCALLLKCLFQLLVFVLFYFIYFYLFYLFFCIYFFTENDFIKHNCCNAKHTLYISELDQS